MTDADDVVDIAQGELEELVCEDAAGVCEAEEAVICEHSVQTHGAGMEDCLIAQVAQTGMAVHYLDLLADDDVPEDGEEGEDGGERGFAVDGPEGNVVDFEAIGEVADSFAAFEGVGDDNDFVATVDEFLVV